MVFFCWHCGTMLLFIGDFWSIIFLSKNSAPISIRIIWLIFESTCNVDFFWHLQQNTSIMHIYRLRKQKKNVCLNFLSNLIYRQYFSERDSDRCTRISYFLFTLSHHLFEVKSGVGMAKKKKKLFKGFSPNHPNGSNLAVEKNSWRKIITCHFWFSA